MQNKNKKYITIDELFGKISSLFGCCLVLLEVNEQGVRVVAVSKTQNDLNLILDEKKSNYIG